MTRFRGHRVESTRLKQWSYLGGNYFVTICARDRECFFGDITNQEIALSNIGQIAHNEWLHTPTHRPYVELDVWTVMPDHFHGILHLHNVAANSTESEQQPAANQFGPLKPGSLQAVINGYKGAVTRQSRKAGHGDFGWQDLYWDHVIRNERELRAIREYIIANPAKWSERVRGDPGLWM